MNGRNRKSLLVFFIYYIAYTSIYVARSNFNIASALMESMGTLTVTQIGIIGSIFSAVYAVMKIPSGYIGDRVSVRKIMTFGLMVTALSNLFIGFLPGFYSIAVLWGLNACGQSVLWGPMLRAINEYYGPERGKVLCQRVITSCTVGSMLGTLLAGACSTALGAAACFLIPGAMVLVLSVIVNLTLRGKETKRAETAVVKPKSFGYVLRDRGFQKMAAPALLYGVVRNNISGWMAIYFMDMFGIDLQSVSFFVFIMPVFSLLGQTAFPRFCRILGNESRVTAAAFGLCAVSMLPMCFNAVTPLTALILIAAGTVAIAQHGVHFVSLFPSQYAGVGSVSLVASMTDSLCYVGSCIGSALAGVLIEQWGYSGMYAVMTAFSFAGMLTLLPMCRAKKTAGNI